VVLWFVVLVFLILLLGLIFGGYRKGSKVSEQQPPQAPHGISRLDPAPVADGVRMW
jgi:hypothetical protein